MRPFLVSVDILPPEGQTYRFQLQPGEVDRSLADAAFQSVRLVQPLSAEIRLVPAEGDYALIGEFSTRIESSCVRCLAPFQEGVGEKFHLIFGSDTPAPDGPVRVEEVEFEPLQGGEVDLAAVVIEQLFLSLRPHPVCREACRGLCPGCGADLNEAECRCEPASPDPRFALLQSWARRG